MYSLNSILIASNLNLIPWFRFSASSEQSRNFRPVVSIGGEVGILAPNELPQRPQQHPQQHW
jgi:hypothetical protein